MTTGLRKRAIVVDDSRAMRALLRRGLISFGYDVIDASDGRDALKTLASTRIPDIALVDWNMPGMDGNHAHRGAARGPRVRRHEDRHGEQRVSPRPYRARTAGRSRRLHHEAILERGARRAARETRVGAECIPLGVILVDDSATVLRIVGRALREHPEIELVGLARDGREALTLVESVGPEAVVLDIEMPCMNGLETLTELRRKHPLLPIVMFSSRTEPGARATFDAIALGASDYVLKPSTSHDNVDTTMKLLADKLIALVRTRRRLAKVYGVKERSSRRPPTPRAPEPPATPKPTPPKPSRHQRVSATTFRPPAPRDRHVDGWPPGPRSTVARPRSPTPRPLSRRTAHAADVYTTDGVSPRPVVLGARARGVAR